MQDFASCSHCLTPMTSYDINFSLHQGTCSAPRVASHALWRWRDSWAVNQTRPTSTSCKAMELWQFMMMMKFHYTIWYDVIWYAPGDTVIWWVAIEDFTTPSLNKNIIIFICSYVSVSWRSKSSTASTSAEHQIIQVEVGNTQWSQHSLIVELFQILRINSNHLGESSDP